MKTKPSYRSALFDPRVLIGFAFCAIGLFCALTAFGLYPGGKAFARQDQPSVQKLAQPNVPMPDSRHALLATTADVEEVMAPDSLLTARDTASPDVIGAVFVVNTTADTVDAAPGDGTCADAGGFCSLRAAISEANALAGTDWITLPAGTYTQTLAGVDDLNASGDLDIRSSIIINGAGSETTIIQANAAPDTATERVMHVVGVAATTVNLNDVTIRHGNATGVTTGGGVSVAVNSVVTFANVVITLRACHAL